jgi:hypothetical protein
MALVACKECNKGVSDSAKVCVGCGAPIESIKKVSIVQYALLVLFGIIVYSCATTKDKAQDQSTPNQHINAPIPIEASASIDEPFSKDGYTLLSATVDSIISRGNSCNIVSMATVSSFDGSWTISCDNHKYEYEFKDVGGKLEYKVVR